MDARKIVTEYADAFAYVTTFRVISREGVPTKVKVEVLKYKDPDHAAIYDTVRITVRQLHTGSVIHFMTHASRIIKRFGDKVLTEAVLTFQGKTFGMVAEAYLSAQMEFTNWKTAN